MNYVLLLIVAISLISSLSYSVFLFYSRESHLWWSHITDIEKLISFRTEQGLYYSYFQEFIQEDTWLDGYSICHF